MFSESGNKKALNLSHSGLFVDLLGMPGTGLEPVTRGFSVLCSTN